MRLVVKKDQILDIERSMLSKIDNITSELEIIKNLKTNFIWEGKSNISYVKKHDEIVESELKMIYKLEKMISFLDEVVLNYGYVVDQIDGEYRKTR